METYKDGQETVVQHDGEMPRSSPFSKAIFDAAMDGDGEYTGGVSYAGERPTNPSKPEKPDYPNYPA